MAANTNQPAPLPHLKWLMPKNGMFWNRANVLRPDRRNEVVVGVLKTLVHEAHPWVKLSSRPCRRAVETLLCEVVNTATRFAAASPAQTFFDPLAALGLSGLLNEDFDPLADEQSFVDAAQENSRLGQRLSRNVFAALFLAVIEGREKFLAAAAERPNMARQPASGCSPLAQAVDQFLATAWWWHEARVPVGLQIEAPDFVEAAMMFPSSDEDEDDEEDDEE
ncbi:hypothetical protein QBC45DRAFT_334101 [Copromyces sp. CBS 386.78]|nr:hypothetical protein QBC45DRAFT_334101 [Copromyces sp. CBS 386.78]